MSHPHRQAIRLREKERLMGISPDALTRHLTILSVIDGICTTPAQEWLRQAGPIARQLNEESKHDR